ncbi:unnamed protein product, partial [Urochloa humidicola]
CRHPAYLKVFFFFLDNAHLKLEVEDECRTDPPLPPGDQKKLRLRRAVPAAAGFGGELFQWQELECSPSPAVRLPDLPGLSIGWLLGGADGVSCGSSVDQLWVADAAPSPHASPS